MKNKLLKIINHYGIDNQLKYIHSEYYELDEAIIIEEDRLKHIGTKGWNIDHIAEEIADIQVMLKQFQYYYDISDKQLKSIMNYKIDRQLDRIKKEGK